MKSQCDEKMSDFIFSKTRTISINSKFIHMFLVVSELISVFIFQLRNCLERCKIWSKNSRTVLQVYLFIF
ncbi:hypothetical protein ACSBR1_015809 [Camellia fascicularis]